MGILLGITYPSKPFRSCEPAAVALPSMRSSFNPLVTGKLMRLDHQRPSAGQPPRQWRARCCAQPGACLWLAAHHQCLQGSITAQHNGPADHMQQGPWLRCIGQAAQQCKAAMGRMQPRVWPATWCQAGATWLLILSGS